MKKNLCYFCMIGVLFTVLTGCGAGKNFENTVGVSGASVSGVSVSGASISGASVSGVSVSGASVSGQAAGTETAAKKETSGEAKKTASEYSGLFYTDNFAYEQDGIHILQRTFDGKMVKKYTFPGKVKKDYIELVDVSREEIFYSVEYEESSIVELWSIPITGGQDNETLQLDKASKILEDHFIAYYLDCNADYIAYTSGRSYKEYNRKKKKSVVIDKEHPKRTYYDVAAFSESGNCKKAILLVIEPDKKDLYVHKPGTGEVKRIVEDYYPEEGELIIGKSEDKIFYTADGTESGNPNYDIWCYDCETGENIRYLTKKQLDKVSYMDVINELHIWGDTLHIAGYSEPGEDEKDKVVSVSIETGQAKEEKKLKKFLRSHNCGVYTFDRDICLMLDDDNDTYSFDMVTKKGKKIKSGDPEYTYWEMP